MARPSRSGHVKKLCDCKRWKTCVHPWFVHYRKGEHTGGTVLRRKIALLVGREPVDYADAIAQARRAIVAWETGTDARNLLPGDAPTLADLLDAYNRERPRTDRWQIGRILKTELPGRQRFGDYRADAITADTLKTFRRLRPTVAGNRDLHLLRAAFNWAVLGGLVPRTPFRVGDVPAVKMLPEEARTRRLQPGEADRLLAAANGSLRDLIIAALETGMRKGEILSLQWWQVRFTPTAELFLPAVKTKTKRDRRVPISTALKTAVDARRCDPTGAPLPPEAFVFGDELGRRRASFKTSWRLACRRALITDLHFHDLRREAGSRWMDAGIPLGTIQRWLGHSNIAQTSTYLGASLGADAEEMQRFEQRIGRLPELPQIAVFDGTRGGSEGGPGPEAAQARPHNTRKPPVVH